MSTAARFRTGVPSYELLTNPAQIPGRGTSKIFSTCARNLCAALAFAALSRWRSRQTNAADASAATEWGSEMNSAVFRRWRENARVEETRLEAGEIIVHIVPASKLLTVAVAGRTTVDTSPYLRSVLLGLLRRCTAPVVVIDVSALSYLDMSGIATLLEALKAARERSVKLRLTGMSGQARTLAEIAQLDTIYRAWGSEVEFR